MTQATSAAIARAISDCFAKIRAGELPRRLQFDLEPQRSSGRKVRLDDLTPVIRENIVLSVTKLRYNLLCGGKSLHGIGTNGTLLLAWGRTGQDFQTPGLERLDDC